MKRVFSNYGYIVLTDNGCATSNRAIPEKTERWRRCEKGRERKQGHSESLSRHCWVFYPTEIYNLERRKKLSRGEIRENLMWTTHKLAYKQKVL